MRTLHKNLAVCIVLITLAVNLFGLKLIPAQAQSSVPDNPVYVYLFWGDGCPHCAKAKPYLENLVSIYPQIVLKQYEIYYDEQNLLFFNRMADKYGIEQLAVPTIFIGSRYFQGYSEQMDSMLEATVLNCIEEGCSDAASGIADPQATATLTKTTLPATTPSPEPLLTKASTISETQIPEYAATTTPVEIPEQTRTLDLPVLGKVDLNSTSLWVSTTLIALVDGVNPCSLWVLTMLLALTLHTGSRKKVFIIGIVFLTITAGIYALFIVGLFSVLKIVSFMGWIRILISLIALFFAVVNIKDYFWYKEGISLTIADEKKPEIFKRMRAVMDASQSFGGLVGATAALAVGVSLVEFSCTAGFPVIWTNLLTSQHVSESVFILLLILYMLLYQLDEMIIFFASVASLKASRVEEKHGRVLKLFSGMLMLTLSIVMLVNPSLMNNLSSSLIIFGCAFLAVVVVLFIHRNLLPRFGVEIGNVSLGRKRNSRHSR